MLFTHSSLMVLLTATLFASPNFALPAPAPAGSLDIASDSEIAILFERDPKTLDERYLNSITTIRANCDLRKAVIPTGSGPSYLSNPAPMQLKLVLLGRGTQNYTCADSTANSKPVAYGADATLFDASCFAAAAPELLHLMPQTMLSNFNKAPGALFPQVGKHYFHPDAATPVFTLTSNTLAAKKGKFVGKKAENVPAPSNAPVGIVPDAFGAVDWLKLVNKVDVGTAAPSELQSVGYKAAYRVQTAGGKPPTTCEGRPTTFSVKYATEYWLYN